MGGYLHGRALDLGGAADGLIFSVPEYARAARDFSQWHASFQTHYLEDPFIVCGASLAEEVDIAEAIRTKSFSKDRGFPSFIVSHSLDDGQASRMRRLNLIPIVCALEEFFTIAQSELVEYRKQADAVISRLKLGTYQRFTAQFRQLDVKSSSMPAIVGTDFYGGDEPTWNDILGSLDAFVSVTKRASDMLDSGDQRYAVLVHGGRVSGKSTALLRIAHQALRKGLKPFWFRHEEGFNADVVADFLSAEDKAVLLVDDAASYLEAIGKCLKLASAAGKAARIFLTLRSARLRGFRIDIDDVYRHEFWLGPIPSRDMDPFVEKRRSASRLGKHIAKSNSTIVRELETACKSELLECVSYIEFAEPIRQRVRKIVLAALQNPRDRQLIARVVCVHRFGFSLPLRVALAASGLSPGALQSVLDGQLKAEEILVRDPRGIRLRHRILSEYAWTDCFDQADRYEAMAAVVNALAPLVNPDVIKAKGIEHLILREILDQEQVSQSIGTRALDFYEEHEPDLGWSSRYWDQRALLESSIEGHFSKAYSYSQKAISLERHPFGFTSLGTICMTHSIKLVGKNRMESMKYFYEGEDALTTSLNLSLASGHPNEHPFVKFFASATQLLRRMDPKDSEFSAVLQLFRIWLSRAKNSDAYSSTYNQKELRRLEAIEIKESLRSLREAT